MGDHLRLIERFKNFQRHPSINGALSLFNLASEREFDTFKYQVLSRHLEELFVSN